MIELKDIARRYRTGGQTVNALDGVDLTIERGEFVGVTGPSGSGKSTLLNVLGCLDRPDAGHYLLEGTDVAGLDDGQLSDLRNRRIGFVFQSFHLMPRLTVLENVLLPLELTGTGEPERAAELLRQLGLGDRLNHFPRELSGGMLKRAALARALALDPELLFLDEPTSGLDPASAAGVNELILRTHQLYGPTIVIVTHDLDLLWQVSDRVAVLGEGRVLALDTMDELSRHEHPIVSAYFTHPRSRRRAAA
jgi:putative ABC transport system ATP-binding protein